MALVRRGSERTHAEGNEANLPTFRIGEHPQLMFTWGANVPDKVKVQKVVRLWPLKFKLQFDYDSHTRSTTFGTSCKDSILGGRIRWDPQRLEYRKRIHLGGVTSLGLTAQLDYPGLWTGQPLNPSAGLAFDFGSGAAMWAGNVFDLKKKLPVSRALDLEVCGSAQVPVPRAQYTVNSQQQNIALGQGPLHLHVAEVNVRLNL